MEERAAPVTVRWASDASGHKWGGYLSLPGQNAITFGVYWSSNVHVITDICYKEALALYFVLLSEMYTLLDRRVHVQVDSQSPS